MVANLDNALDFFNAIFEDLDSVRFPTNTPIYTGNFPPCDVVLNDESKDMIIKLAVAGISKDEISLKSEGDYLFLNIDPLKEGLKEGYTILQQGIKHSSVRRKFYVPISRYQLDKINVALKDGMLLIEVPAKEEMKSKTINIK